MFTFLDCGAALTLVYLFIGLIETNKSFQMYKSTDEQNAPVI